ncbi:MAG: thioredoxin domain-containing protein [Nitrospirae bacterium CG_4_10_14_3_um_filter_44_29]|nr:MAG: thioredoxin domain-containing protein [Nitrospirae bacterium CG22_combo_CG10-13_8_21_14_all_44_11]PIX87800.1 MAG: thioredoxin domain-containing protein [Nitrospirae bacterium CG_4_10_14_3_um_filter_44_29]
MNKLAQEKSAYLKHSADQKIDWNPWSDEAFERARLEDKPVFLSSGAIWCHWCHVMAKECFEDEEIITFLNEHFINIKIDRDERPDIDRRYQQAVSLMTGGSGWPLSVFLTHERKPFFGGTYFPPDDRFGRPGFRKILKRVSEYYKQNKDEIKKYSESLIDSLKRPSDYSAYIETGMLDEAVKATISEFDPQNGGFGTAPKFPMPGAMEFLINRYFFSGQESVGFIVKKSLYAMAKGGFHDQLAGGFHRYSTDEAWIIPHFEKMADDNAWLLRNYIDAYSVFGDDYFRETAEGIINFVKDVLSDKEGGFYASQDADVTPDDEGGYFTWTEKDIRETLTEEEFRIFSFHLFHEEGSMHHDVSKKVLFVAKDIKNIAAETGMPVERIYEIIKNAKGKLLEKRYKRQAPFIDTNPYTSLNGMMITSFVKAARAFGNNSLKEFALKSLNKILELHFINNELLHSEGVKALLDDYVYLAVALTAAYEITGNASYLEKADSLMDSCLKKFWDAEENGLFDTDSEVIGLRLKGVEDVPHPSPNAEAIMLLLKLYHLTDKNSYLQYAEKALRAFSLRAKDFGIHAGYYYAALDAYFNMLRLTLYTSRESDLALTALSTHSPYTSIAHGKDRGYVLPCLKSECVEPVYSVEGLKLFLKNRGAKKT